MQAIALALMIPLMLLNVFGGLVGGIWLAVLGRWSALFSGIGFLIAGAFILSILMLPGMLFAAPAAMAAEKGRNVIAAIFGLPAILWTYAVMVGCCILTFSWIVSKGEGEFPFLLWGYAVATGPWAFLASKDSQAGNDSSGIPLVFAQLGTFAMMAAAYTDNSDLSFGRLIWWFGPFMLGAIILQLFMLIVAVRQQPAGY
jgi:hypothetical protein